MKQIDDIELKKIEYDILCFINDFCIKNNIKYSLASGTLLGAVRHKGFIPWDDDIDIFMVRDQYEKFINLFLKNDINKYSILDYRYCKEYNYLFAKVIDTSTILIEDHNKINKKLGVYVDVFPIDTIDNSFKGALKRYKRINFLKYISVAYNWKHFYINRQQSMLRQFPRFVFYFFSRFANIKKVLSKIESHFNFEPSLKYWGCLYGAYGTKDVFLKENYCDYTWLNFENGRFMVFKDYDLLLKSVYGNYMKLPPRDKRFSRHTFKAYYR